MNSKAARRRAMAALEIAVVGGVSCVAAQAVPPPTPDDLAGCATSTFVVDATVCSDTELKASDDKLRASTERLADRLASAGEWIEPQEGWFQRRNRCAMEADQRGCLHDAYAERLAVLAAIEAPPPPAFALKCNGTLLATGAAEFHSGAVLSNAEGYVIAVAFPAGQSAWQPFVTLQPAATARRWQFERIDGKRAGCS